MNKSVYDFPTDIMLGDLTLRCRDCFQQFQCRRFLPYFDATKVKHCVVCGGTSLTRIPWNDDPWRAQGAADQLWTEVAMCLGISKEAAQEFHKVWAPVDGDEPRFIDYVRNLLEEYRK